MPGFYEKEVSELSLHYREFYMPENFFIRLREYYLKVAAVLRGEADSASIFLSQALAKQW